MQQENADDLPLSSKTSINQIEEAKKDLSTSINTVETIAIETGRPMGK